MNSHEKLICLFRGKNIFFYLLLASFLSACGGGDSKTTAQATNSSSEGNTTASPPTGAEDQGVTSTESPPSSQIDEVLLKVRFSGSFTTTTNYTPATGEKIIGSLAGITGNEIYADNTFTTSGGKDGLVFTPQTPLTSGFNLSKPLLVEARIKKGDKSPAAFDTLVSVFGGVYFRYPDKDLTSPEYGMYGSGAPYFDTNYRSPKDLSKTEFDHVAFNYQPNADGTSSLTVFLNGCVLSDVVTIPKYSAVNKNAVIFGNDAQVSTRGAKASFEGVALSTMKGAATPADFQLEAPACKPTTQNGLSGATGVAVPLAEVISVDGDAPGRIVEKAAYVIPSKSQYDWQTYGLTAFLHYGMNTFMDKDANGKALDTEWSYGDTPASTYAPENIDPDQWMKVLKRNGFKIAILTVKHHDGFLLYPTRYSPYSVKNSPWWTSNADKATGVNPKGDVVREFVNAARNNGMKVGFYLSPADGAELNVAGKQGGKTFSNKSSLKNVSIPVLVSNDNRTRDPAKTYNTAADDYNTYFMNQLYELLTEYGTIDEMWFDGANPYESWPQNYQFTDWFSLIRKLQPSTLLAVSGPDIRWIGSESGAFRANEWSPQAFRGNPADLLRSSQRIGDSSSSTLGSSRSISGVDLAADKKPTYLSWSPAEADVSIRPGWFYHPSQDSKVKSADALFSLYENAVGRNAVLLLNVPPNKNGVISDLDIKSLDGMGTIVKNTYGKNILAGTQSDPKAVVLTDSNPETDWTPGTGQTTGSVDIQLPVNTSFNRILLQENILKGQRIESVSVKAKMSDGSWKEVATAGAIGYKRIIPLATKVTADALRVDILQSRAQPYLGSVEVYTK